MLNMLLLFNLLQSARCVHTSHTTEVNCKREPRPRPFCYPAQVPDASISEEHAATFANTEPVLQK